MNDRLNGLIDQVDTTTWIKTTAPGVTSAKVRSIIEFGHIHFSPAYPGMPVKNEVAIVVMPDQVIHTVQITVDKHDRKKNHLCCVTCLNKDRVHCVAAIAALVVKIAEQKPPKKEMDCPGCGDELEPATAYEDYGLWERDD